MNKENLEQRLRQARDDKILSIQTSDTEIERLESQLKALDKATLGHLDYGYDKDGDPFVMVQSNVRHKLEHANEYGLVQDSNILGPTVLGNSTADLKRNSKDLERFEVKAANVESGFVAEIVEYGERINIGTSYETWNFYLPEAVTIHQKLGQLIATLRRRNAQSTNKKD